MVTNLFSVLKVLLTCHDWWNNALIKMAALQNTWNNYLNCFAVKVFPELTKSIFDYWKVKLFSWDCLNDLYNTKEQNWLDI